MGQIGPMASPAPFPTPMLDSTHAVPSPGSMLHTIPIPASVGSALHTVLAPVSPGLVCMWQFSPTCHQPCWSRTAPCVAPNPASLGTMLHVVPVGTTYNIGPELVGGSTACTACPEPSRLGTTCSVDPGWAGMELCATFIQGPVHESSLTEWGST